jgi:hypothetical protein
MSEVMQPSKLDLQLAWSFRDFPIVWDRLESLGVRLADVEQVWARHIELRRSGREPTTLEEHIAFYGVEPRQEPRDDGLIDLRWPLARWPEHEYLGVAVARAGVFHQGLRLRRPRIVERIEAPFTLEQASDALRLGVDTEIELAEALGPGDPDDGNGWAPDAFFSYTLADGRALRCLTIHGLIVDLSAVEAAPRIVRDAVPISPRTRRWWEFWKPAA